MVTTPEEQPQPHPVVCNKYRGLLLVVFAFSLFAAAFGLGVYCHLQKNADPWMPRWKSGTTLGTRNYSRTSGIVLITVVVISLSCSSCSSLPFSRLSKSNRAFFCWHGSLFSPLWLLPVCLWDRWILHQRGETQCQGGLQWRQQRTGQKKRSEDRRNNEDEKRDRFPRKKWWTASQISRQKDCFTENY